MVNQLFLDLEGLATFFTLVPAAGMGRDEENKTFLNTFKSRTSSGQWEFQYEPDGGCYLGCQSWYTWYNQ